MLPVWAELHSYPWLRFWDLSQLISQPFETKEEVEPWNSLDHYNLPWPVIVPALQNNQDPREFNVGEEVFITGLFYQHSGTDRNLPIIRMATIAGLPQERVNAQVGSPRNPREAKVEAYLIETRSQMGLSGSPVYVVPTQDPWNRPLLQPETIYTPKTRSPVYLLGILTHHFGKELAEVEDPSSNVAKANVGIAIVVPHYKIAEYFASEEVLKVERDLIQARSNSIVSSFAVPR